jgi:hypothetical protein
LVIASLSTHGNHSTSWAVTIAVDVITAGALIAVALAGVSTVLNNTKLRRRLALSAVPALAAILLALVPPPVIARSYRWLDLVIGAPWILILLPAAIVISACLLSPARLRTVAAAAGLVWCLNITAAFVALQVHRTADKRYQQTVVAGRLDEITARLGPHWQEQYLGPVRAAFLPKDARP